MAESTSLPSPVLNTYLWKSVWAHFGLPALNGEFLEKDKKKRLNVFCKICKQSLSYKGNTTNMMVHLHYNHKAKYEKIASKPSSTSREISLASSLQQQSIKESFKQLEPLK